jgi:ribonuclease T1
MDRRRFAFGAIGLFIVVLAGWLLFRSPSPGPSRASVGTPTCPLTTLPPEVTETVGLIHSGGPFPFPRNDGAVFGNREGHLPAKNLGYYHEYTVVTPGARDRAEKRIVTGGTPITHPAQYFYSGDHYDSFCLVTGAEGR